MAKRKREESKEAGGEDPREMATQTGNSNTAPEDEVPIFMRISKTKMEAATKGIKEAGSRKDFFVRLLDAYLAATDSNRAAILGVSNAFKSYGDLNSLVSWSSHSFSLKHWSWCIKCYEKLIDHAVRLGSVELENFALYRLGYAWNEFGLLMREHAMEAIELGKKSLWNRDYANAMDCIQRGIVCTRKMTDEHRIARAYNLACAYSQLAQLTVEKDLKLSGPWAIELSQAQRAVRTLGNRTAVSTVWKTIGSEWRAANSDGVMRSVYFDDSIGTSGINTFVEKAMDELKQTIVKAPPAQPKHIFAGKKGLVNEGATSSGPSLIPWPDRNFFHLFALNDEDLLFLQFDSDARKKMDAEGFTEPLDGDWLYESYKSLVENQGGI